MVRDGGASAHFVCPRRAGTFCLRLLKPPASRTQRRVFPSPFLFSPQPQTITHTHQNTLRQYHQDVLNPALPWPAPVQISQNSVSRLTQLSQHPHSLSSS